MSGDDKDEVPITTIKTDGGKFELTSKRLLIYKESKGAAAMSSVGASGGLIGGAIAGAIGGLLSHRAGTKPAGEIPLATIKTATAKPGKGGMGTMVLAFVNGKETPIPDVPGVVDFVAKINQQLAAIKPAPAPAPAAAPPTIAKPGTVITLDTKVQGLPGWQILPNFPKLAVGAEVRFKADAPGTQESMFIRSKEEMADCVVRLVYSFAVLPRFAYVGVRVRSRLEGKSYALVGLNSKGELLMGGAPPLTPAPKWVKQTALHEDPAKPNEVRLVVTGAKLEVFLNGQLAATREGLEGPTGRVVIVGYADPKGAEILVGALSIETT